MSGSISLLLVLMPVLLFSVVAHEWAHARVAVAQGDSTPVEAGRLTLNPIPHLSLFGSLVVPAVLWLAPGGFIFGWAKPVPVDPEQYRDTRRGDILVSLAGVTANFVLVGVGIAAWAAAAPLASADGSLAALGGTVQQMARFGVLLNLILGVFNLVPIPPLDGSHVLYRLLPERLAERYLEVGRYGVLLLVAAFLFPEMLDVVFEPVRVLDGWAMGLARSLT